MWRTLTPLAGALSVLALAAPARAQQADSAARAAAVELFDAAQVLMEQDRFADACPKFAESYRLDPQLGAVLHLGDCLEKAGKLASAYASYREAAELAAKSTDPRASLAEDRAKALAPRLSRLIITVVEPVKTPGLEVLRDGLRLNQGSWGTAIAVDAGEHAIEARAAGYQSWQSRVTVAEEGSSLTVEVPPLEPSPDAVAQGGATSSAAALDSKADSGAVPAGNTQRILGIVVGGAGVVGLGLGLVFTLQKNDRLDSRDAVCPSGINCATGDNARIAALTDEARSAQTLATISFIGGGLALAGGAALFLTAPTASSTASTVGRTRLIPVWSPGAAGLIAKHTF